MADQCIVCLEELDAVPVEAVDVAATNTELSTTQPSNPSNQLPIALIKPCNHVLHDECLREWSQKANSCPICRQAFNLVEVLDKVGGKSNPRFRVYHCSATAFSATFFFCTQLDVLSYWSFSIT